MGIGSSVRSIIGVGMSAGPGRGARSVALALRAGWHETTPLTFSEGVVLGIASPALPAPTPRGERIASLASQAIGEALRGLELADLALFLALPDDSAEEVPLDVAAIVRAVTDASHGSVDAARTSVVRGELAAPVALLRAIAALDDRGVEAVVVGGADSLVTPEVIARLVSLGRLVAAGSTIDARPGHAVPSEGAGFVVIVKGRSERAMAHLGHVASGTSDDGEVVGGALGDALVVATATLERVWLISDFDRSVEGSEAFAAALGEIRARRDPGRPLEIRHDRESGGLGDTGVAGFALALALASASHAVGGLQESASVILSNRPEGTATATVKAVRTTAAAPSAIALAETPAHTVARALEPVVRGWIAQAAHAERRLSTSGTSTFAGRLRQLLARATAVAESPLEEAIVARVDRLVSAMGASARAAAAGARAAEKMDQDARSILDGIAMATARVATRVASTRPAVVSAAAALTGKPGSTAERGFVTSRGVPALLALPYAPPSAFSDESRGWGVEQLDRVNDGEEDTDGGIEGEGEATAERALEDAPSTSDASVQADLDALEKGMERALGVIDERWRARSPANGEPWSPAFERIEGDMLAELDWLHALLRPPDEGGSHRGGGIVVARLRKPDSHLEPGRAFARTWVLACSTDPRLVRAAASKARLAAGPLQRAYEDALALGSSPSLESALEELCASGDPQAPRIALRVMARRRTAPVGAITPLLYHPDASVRRSAARALAFSRARVAGALALESRLSIETAPLVTAEIIVSLLRLGAERAEVHLSRALTGLLAAGESLSGAARAGRLELGRASAALGRAQEALPFAAIARTPDELEVVGWFGRVSSIPKLIGCLEAAEPIESRRAAARALVRILGVVREDHARGMRLVDRPLECIDESALSIDAELYRHYWKSAGSQLGGAVKHRFGRPYEASASLAELALPGRAADRRIAQLEAVLNGARGKASFDVEDWVARQVASLRNAEVDG